MLTAIEINAITPIASNAGLLSLLNIMFAFGTSFGVLQNLRKGSKKFDLNSFSHHSLSSLTLCMFPKYVFKNYARTFILGSNHDSIYSSHNFRSRRSPNNGLIFSKEHRLGGMKHASSVKVDKFGKNFVGLRILSDLRSVFGVSAVSVRDRAVLLHLQVTHA